MHFITFVAINIVVFLLFLVIMKRKIESQKETSRFYVKEISLCVLYITSVLLLTKYLFSADPKTILSIPLETNIQIPKAPNSEISSFSL